MKNSPKTVKSHLNVQAHFSTGRFCRLRWANKKASSVVRMPYSSNVTISENQFLISRIISIVSPSTMWIGKLSAVWPSGICRPLAGG